MHSNLFLQVFLDVAELFNDETNKELTEKNGDDEDVEDEVPCRHPVGLVAHSVHHL